MIPLDPASIANKFLQEASLWKPPVDPRRICALWPTLSVVTESLDKSGYLLDLGYLGGEIIIRAEDPFGRQNFTIAHELAHWILDREEKVDTKKVPRAELEQWCDAFAKALLLPGNWIRDYLRAGSVKELWYRVRKGHRHFNVSREAFRRRTGEISNTSILEVDRNNGTVEFSKQYLSRKSPPPKLRDIFRVIIGQLDSNSFVYVYTDSLNTYELMGGVVRNDGNKRSFLICLVPSSSLD